MVSWKYGFESLLILLETRGIHIGHVVREDLHPTFMGQRSGQDRIDTPIHMPLLLLSRDSNPCARLVPNRDCFVKDSNSAKCRHELTSEVRQYISARSTRYGGRVESTH
jgi:hypothetical protein